MPSIHPLDHIPSAAYDAFIHSQPSASPYHSRAWLDVLQRSYGYTPASLVAQESDGRVVGVLPLMLVDGRLKGRRLVSLPFSHCVPILADSPATETALLAAAIAQTQRQNCAYLEIKPRHAPAHPAFLASTLYHISELDLMPSVDTLHASFSQNNRRNIKKAASAGFVLHTSDDFATFYQLELATRHRQGAPIYPSGFFQHMQALLPEAVRLYLLEYLGKKVAGLVVFQQGERAIYAYGGSVRDEAVNRLRPNNWLMWHAIQAAKAAGCTVFDFGTTPLHHASLLAFKNHFAPQTEALPYWYFLHTRAELPVIQRDSASVKLAEMLLRWLPRPLFQRFSPLLLREVG